MVNILRNLNATNSQSQGSVAQGGNQAPTCATCRDVQSGCFKCEQKGHFMKEYPNNQKGSGQKNKDGSLGICIDYR